jgi:hypothetical protein
MKSICPPPLVGSKAVFTLFLLYFLKKNLSTALSFTRRI